MGASAVTRPDGVDERLGLALETSGSDCATTRVPPQFFDRDHMHTKHLNRAHQGRRLSLPPSQREVSAAAVGQLLHHARAGLRSLD